MLDIGQYIYIYIVVLVLGVCELSKLGFLTADGNADSYHWPLSSCL